MCESSVAVLAWVPKGYLYLVKQITSCHSHRLSWIHNNLTQLIAGFSDNAGCVGEVLILDLGQGRYKGCSTRRKEMLRNRKTKTGQRNTGRNPREHLVAKPEPREHKNKVELHYDQCVRSVYTSSFMPCKQ